MYIGVDLGTSSIKVLLADDEGNTVDSAKRGINDNIFGKCSEEDPAEWSDKFRQCIFELGSRHSLSNVKGISFCGQMHGLVALDENDEVLRPAILWNDGRASKETQILNETYKERLLHETGNIAVCGFTAPKLMWMKRHEPNLFRRIRKIMLPKDYLLHNVCKEFASDVSDCSGTLYFDVKNKRWSEFMLSLLEIDKEMLPKVYESYEAVGNVTRAFSKETGIPESCVVVAGGGDQAVGAVGTGTVADGDVTVSLGTSGVVFAASDNFLNTDGAAHSFCHADGRYHVMAVTLSAAGSLDWWAKKVLFCDNFDELISCAENAVGDCPYFLPYLTGERSPLNDPDAKGMFFGLKASDTRAELTKSVLEGVNFSLSDCAKSLEKCGVKLKNVRVAGGGANSDFWLQSLANCLGVPVSSAAAEGGGLGAVILAMTGCGEFSDVFEGCKRLTKTGRTFQPDIGQTRMYAEKFPIYKKLYEANKEIMKMML